MMQLQLKLWILSFHGQPPKGSGGKRKRVNAWMLYGQDYCVGYLDLQVRVIEI
jgi:hypothetical protein